MKVKKLWSSLLTAFLALGLTLAMLPLAGLKTQAAEISSLTATVSNLVAPEIGNKVVTPTLTAPTDSPASITDYGWTCDGNDIYEGDLITSGTWRIYAAALIDKGISTDTFSATPSLTVDGEAWTFDRLETDEYFYYAFFYKEYTVATSSIIISGDPQIADSYQNIPLPTLNLASYVSGGTAPHTFSKVSGPDWLLVSAAGEISGNPTTLGYNDNLFVLIVDNNNQKQLVEINVQPTRVDYRPAVYEITAEGPSPESLVKQGETLNPITFTNIDPAHVSIDSSKSSWQKYDPESGVWKKQEFGTTFTPGTYRYRVYTSADSATYSYAHPDFYLKLAEDDWQIWNMDNYNSTDAWGCFVSDAILVPEAIKDVTIKGAPVPIDGIGATTSEITVKEDGLFVSAAQWYDMDGNPLNDGDPFDQTKEYKVSVTVNTDAGFIFAPQEVMKITINGILTPAKITSYSEYEITAESWVPFGAFTSNLYVVLGGSVNVRENASYLSDRIGGLHFGDLIQAEVESGAWVKFTFKGQEAWVMRKYLALTYSEDTAILPEKYTVTAGALNVRETYYKDSVRIGGVKLNDVLTITGKITNAQNEEWLIFDFPGEDGHKVGFIMAKYAKSESAKEDEPTEEVKWTGGVPAKVSFATKSAVVHDNTVSISDEYYKDNEDGTYTVNIFPDDAKNFSTLTPDKIELPAGFPLEILELNNKPDGSIDVKLGKPSYAFSKGADGTWIKGSSESYDFTVNRNVNDAQTFTKFGGMEIDGVAVDTANFSATAGSLNVSLKSSYLETLAVGSHTLKVFFRDGSAETTLTISEKSADDPGNNPGDNKDNGGTPGNNGSNGSNGSGISGGSSGTGTSGAGNAAKAGGSAAKTGDQNDITLYVSLLLLSLLVIGGTLYYRKRAMK